MDNQMNIVRSLVHLANRVRQQNNIPLSHDLLDVAYGGPTPEDYYLDAEHRRELCRAVGLHDQGYDFADLNTYEHYNNLGTPPDDPKWKCTSADGLYVCLDTRVPDWLKEVHQKRKEHRAEMQARKDAGIAQA